MINSDPDDTICPYCESPEKREIDIETVKQILNKHFPELEVK